jgi:alkylation response protein AidB-like acyl-CoA dehydrogenase
VGCAAGAIEQAIQYAHKRKQFGKEISSFQLNQEKISRAVGEIQSMLTMVQRVSKLYEQGQASMGMIAMTKAHCTRTAREVCQIARELVGGNGILLEHHVMKQMMDLEGVHTYEGSYEINSLVSARELTGKAAFK